MPQAAAKVQSWLFLGSIFVQVLAFVALVILLAAVSFTSALEWAKYV